MNKLIWIALGIIVLVVVGFMVFGGDDSDDEASGGLVVTDPEPTAEEANTFTSDEDVLNEIDSALEFFE